MQFLPLDTPELIERVAGWLAMKENWQWFDFGDGRQTMTPAMLKIMTMRETHFLRVYTGDDDRTPLGLAGFSNVNRAFGTATLWGVSGAKSFRYRGYANLAAPDFLTLGFRELNLHVINTWIVENNPSRRLLERMNFRFAGRQRQCHCIDGRRYDRLWYDLLASEHRENVRPLQTEVATRQTERVW